MKYVTTINFMNFIYNASCNPFTVNVPYQSKDSLTPPCTAQCCENITFLMLLEKRNQVLCPIAGCWLDIQRLRKIGLQKIQFWVICLKQHFSIGYVPMTMFVSISHNQHTFKYLSNILFFTYLTFLHPNREYNYYRLCKNEWVSNLTTLTSGPCMLKIQYNLILVLIWR